MTNGTVLVTGAAGGMQGSTGNQVVRMLAARGLPVRAFVHHDDDRAAALRKLDVEVVVGDLRDIASVRPAMQGVRRAFFTYGVDDGLLDAAAAFATAATEQQVEQVVEVSQLASAPDAPTPRMRQHWVAEQVFDWAGVGAVHLRAGVFFENLRALITPSDAGEQLAAPLGGTDTVLPLVAAQDVARVAAGILAAPQPRQAGFVRLVGELIAVGDIVDTYRHSLGRELRYVDIPGTAWHQAVLGIGLNAHAAEHLTKLWEYFRAAGPSTRTDPICQVTGVIQEVGGQPPQTFETFLAAHPAPPATATSQ